MLSKAIDRVNENKAWQLYVNVNPHMTEENYMTFEEFLNRDESITDDRPVDEILNDVKETLDTFRGRWTT